MAQAGVAYVTIKPDWQGFNRDLKRSAPNMNREFAGMGGQIGRSFAGLGKQAGVAFARSASTAAKVGAVGIGASLVGAVKVAGDFEQQLSSLGSVSDASAKQMEALRSAAVKAGAATKFSALDAAKAQTELAKGGLSTSQILKGGLNSALALAAAGEMDLADAASTTVNAMKLFGIRGKDSIGVADALATAANSTTADVSDFSLALDQAGSAAKTVGLSFPETITALETLAEVGVKGSDAGTSLKTALVQLASPSSDKAVEMARKLGINIFDSTGKIKPLVEVSKELQDGLGGLTEQQRIQAATTLVGQDGFRALLALYDAGPQKVAKLERELGKQGSAAEVAKKKQDNLKGSLEQLGGSFETLGVNVGTLMIPAIRDGADALTDFTNDIGKVAADDKLDLGEKLQKSFEVAKVDAAPWVRKLKRAIIRADIPGEIGDLLTRGSDRIGEGFEGGDFVDQLVRQVDAADLPEKFGDLVSEIAPKIAEAAAKAGVLSAGTFVKAFAGADAWGKLALGTFLLSKMGGVGALKTLGKKAADAFGSGGSGSGRLTGGTSLLGKTVSKANPVPVFVVNPGGVPGPGGGVGPTLGNVGKGVVAGRLVPVFAAGGASALAAGGLIAYLAVTHNENLPTKGPGASSPSNPKGHVGFDQGAPSRRVTSDAPGAVIGKDEGLAAAAAGAEQLRKRMREVAGDIKKLQGSAKGDFGKIAADASENFRRIKDSIGNNSAEGQRLADRNFSAAATAIGRAMGDGKGDVRSAMSTIRGLLDRQSGKGKDALARNYGLIVPAVRDSMSAAERETGKGLALIQGLMVEQLKSLGFTKDQAINIAKTGDPDANKGREGGASSVIKRQRGGSMFISGGQATVPGSGSGDKVHLQAMVEPGEEVFVLNRNASKKLGQLQALNAAVPRFQKGGSVTGDTDFVPALMNALRQLSAAAGIPISVQSGRRTVAEQLALGPSTPGHPVAGPNGPHVRGVAADITPGFAAFGKLAGRFGLGFTVMPQEPWHIQLLDAAKAAAADIAAPELKRLLVDGPASSLKSVVQGALDTTRAAAQRVVERAAAASTANGPESAVGTANATAGGQYDKAALKRLWTGAGGDPGIANLMAAIALAESGGNPAAHNPSGASGLWQILGVPFPGDPFDPATNARMAVSKYESQGLGAWEVYTKGTYRQYLQQGGMVSALMGLVKGGPAKGLAGPKKGIKPPLPGGIDLGKALGKIKTGRTTKLKDAATTKLLDSISGIGFTEQAQQLAFLSGNADRFGDYADRASRLTDSGKIQEALEAELERRQTLSPIPNPLFPADAQQAIVDQFLGRVSGGTQLDWLKHQLTALFDWRNVIADTDPIVVKLRDDTATLLRDAEKRLEAIAAQIKQAEREYARVEKERDRASRHEDTLKDRIRDEMDKPRKKRDEKKLAGWREDLVQTHTEHVALNQQLSNMRGEKRSRERIQTDLTDKVIPALTEKRDSLEDSHGDLLGNLVDAQGLGGPTTRLAVLPPLGSLGGKLFDVQSLIHELTDNPPRIEATVPEQTKPSAFTTDQLLDVLELSKALVTGGKKLGFSDEQIALKGQDALPFAGSFDTGGPIPGPVGKPYAAIVHGGEHVLTAEEARAGVGGDTIVKVFIDGQEFRGIVRTEIRERERVSKGAYRAGRLP